MSSAWAAFMTTLSAPSPAPGDGLLRDYALGPAYDEMFARQGVPRPHYQALARQLADRDAPTLGSRRLKHAARRCADLTHRNQIVPRAARAVGVLIAILYLVPRCLLHLHA